MWERSKRLMFGFKVEFDKFAAKEGESLECVYERLTTLVNIMDRNNVCPISVSIYTKFLNCLQPEWIKYVTMVRHNQTGDIVSYDVLYDSLVQFEPRVLASKAKKAAKNHDPLALIAHSNASSSHFNDGLVDIQTKNAGYGGNGNRNAGRQNRNQAFNAGTGKNDETNQIKPRVRDAKYFREKMLLTMKDEAGSNLNDEENDFMLDNSDREKTMEELTTAVMSMARIQPANGKAEAVPSYDRKAVSEVTASSKVHEQAFEDRANRYLEDIVDLEEKLSSHDRIVYKMAGLGYKNPEHLKKAIAAQQKMYDGEMLHGAKLKIDSPNSEETLEDAKEIRLKMRNKMV
ncbi:hypothetical protein Tco_1291588 [Tanacetum coccineum]